MYLESISAYSKLRKFDESSSLMNEAKTLFAESVEEGFITIDSAELSLETADVDRAIGYLSNVKPNEPYYLQAYTKLAEIHLQYRKDRHAFTKCFRELVEHCPGAKTYSMLGNAYMAIQEPDRAIEAYKQFLKTNPGDKILASKMGRALIKTHQYGPRLTTMERTSTSIAIKLPVHGLRRPWTLAADNRKITSDAACELF